MSKKNDACLEWVQLRNQVHALKDEVEDRGRRLEQLGKSNDILRAKLETLQQCFDTLCDGIGNRGAK